MHFRSRLKYSVKALAKQCHYSQDHFIRVFRKYVGMTPLEFIIQAKVEKAMQLLLMSSMTIQGIAGILGYSDAFTFSKQFKAKTGVSPSEYRKT